MVTVEPVLSVPSVVIPREDNLILNPRHADFARLAVGRREPFSWAHSRCPGHALTPTGVMAIRCKQFHLPDL